MGRLGKVTFLLTGAVGALLACMPGASAQDLSDTRPTSAPVQQAQQQQGQVPANMIPGVRYTTGSVTTTGWEKSLTNGDPNLKRWNWSSITSYTQSCYNKVPAGAYVKNNRPSGGIYTKPIQINPDTYAKKRIQPGVIVLAGNHANANVSGHVKLPRQIAKEAPAPKSYNVDYGVAGTVHVPGNPPESLASRQVFGRLMKTQ